MELGSRLLLVLAFAAWLPNSFVFANFEFKTLETHPVDQFKVVEPKEEAPIPHAECKQMECWARKRIRIVQLDNIHPIDRKKWLMQPVNEWNPFIVGSWYTKVYAKHHNIEYELFSAPGTETFRTYFMKWNYLKHTLKDWDIHIVVDFDVMVHDFDQNILCLLERWGFTCDAQYPLILQALNPDDEDHRVPVGADGNTKVTTNTGFMVLRNSRETWEIIRHFTNHLASVWDDWEQWKLRDVGEWTAAARPNLTESAFPDDSGNAQLRLVPCDEANGWWKGEAPCKGVYIGHGWHDPQAALQEQYRRLIERTVGPAWSDIQHDYFKVSDMWPGQEGKQDE